MNPYEIPPRPRVTIRQILIWISGSDSPVTSSRVAARFSMGDVDASVRLNKLWKWGYVRRKKRDLPPRVYEYAASRFGRKAATRWRRGKRG